MPQFFDFLLGKSFRVSKDEINRQNRLAIRYFARMGCPMAIANLFVQTVVQGVPLMTPKNWLLPIYVILLFLAEKLVIPDRYEHCTPLVYILEAPVMILSILLGSFWDPAHQAITFLMFMSVVPIFILDYPVRVGAVGIFWNILFCVAVYITKES